MVEKKKEKKVSSFFNLSLSVCLVSFTCFVCGRFGGQITVPSIHKQCLSLSFGHVEVGTSSNGESNFKIN